MYLDTVAKRSVHDKNPTFTTGDRVRVNYRIVEGEKERVQPFEGVVTVFKKGTANASFTVRKISEGVGVERNFPLYSPLIQSIDLISQGRTRRSRLFYLRDRQGKSARIEAIAGSGGDGASAPAAEAAAPTVTPVTPKKA